MTQPTKLFKSFQIRLHYVSLLFALMHFSTALASREAEERQKQTRTTPLLPSDPQITPS